MAGLSRWRGFLAAAAVLVAVPLVAVVALLSLGMTLDASPWREAIASRASAALGRQVVLEGPLEVTLAWKATLRIGGVRVVNPPGFTTPDFATLQEAQARVDLIALLSGRLRVRGLEASGVRVRLERAADGQTNWVFTGAGTAEPPAAPAPKRFVVDLDAVTLRGFAVEYHDAGTGARHVAEVDELTGTGSETEALRLTMRGRSARGFPYFAAIEAGRAGFPLDSSEPWPLTLDLEFLGTRLHAAGTVAAHASEAQLEFGVGTDNLQDVERFLDAKLPKFDVAALSGRVAARAGAVEVTQLHGVLGDSEFTGHVAFAFGAGRPRATGALAMAEFDLRPFLRESAQDARRPLTYDDLANDPTPLRGLVPVDMALTLRVDRLVGVDAEVRNATLDLTVDARGARAPVTMTVADVPFTGHAELDTSGATPSLTLQLGARGSQLGDLALLVAGLEGVEGGLERIDVRASGRGDTLGAVVRSLDARIELAGARLSYGNFAGGRPIGFAFDTFVLDAQHGQRVRGSARGSLLGKRAAFTLRGRELSRILREGVFPIELDIAAPGVSTRIDGTATDSDTGRATNLSFRVDAARSGDLAEWFGVARQSKLPVSLRGDVRIERGGWHIRDARLRVGRSEVTADVRRTTVGERPITIATLTSPLIDVPELETLRPASDTPPTGERKVSLDVPILPGGLDFADADIALGLERVVLRRTDVANVGFNARVRDGRLPPSPFSATLAGVPFEGRLGLDLRGGVPEATLGMSTSKVDIGALLRSLDVAEDVDAHADSLQVELAGRGGQVVDLLEHSSFEARVVGGDLAILGPANKVVTKIRVKEAVVSAGPGQPIAAHLDGAVDGLPLEMQVTSGTLASFASDASRVPLAVDARAAGATLKLVGEADLPLGRGGRFMLDMAGERLDTLSTLARVELPPWGPWSLSGPIAMTATGYEIRRLALRVGESRLYGYGTLDVAGSRPRLNLRVKAPQIQLDDLPLQPKPEAAVSAPFTTEVLRGYASGVATQTERVLSAAFLRRFDADVDVVVDEVLSGTDRLGDGTLRVQLLDGQLHVSLAEVSLPGGTARLSGTYDPVREGVALVVRAHVERFDYGILARRRWPDTDAEGLFSLDLELTSTARSLNAVLASANGRVDVAVWPKDLGARQVDLWVVNLFRRLLPVIDRGAPSVFNCAVGRFDIAGGTLTEDIFVIDTSRTRVSGTGNLDFATERIDFRFSPRTKRLQLLSLETPVRVTGTFDDFSVGVFPGDVLAAITRFFGSVIVVPLQTLFGGAIPIDGQDVCADSRRLVDPAGR